MKLFFSLISLLGLTFTSFAQERFDIYSNLPDDIRERMETEPPYIEYTQLKNSSYDKPIAIEEYDVNGMGTEVFVGVYEYHYTSAGRLMSIITKDAFLNPLKKFTYNFTTYGRMTSVIIETWNGSSWEFDYRQSYGYTSEQNIDWYKLEYYNNSTLLWDLNYMLRYTYIGGEPNPSRALCEFSTDGQTWSNNIASDFSYLNGVITEIEILQWNSNYLMWVPAQKREISNWGMGSINIDFLLAQGIDPQNITDERINKINYWNKEAQRMTLYSSFNYSNWTYDDARIYDYHDDGTNRTNSYTIQENLGIMDTLSQSIFFYDPCYGYSGSKTLGKNIFGDWETVSGVFYDGEKVNYSNSCYVTAYDIYSDINTSHPTGIRSKRFVITQATNLGIDDKDLMEPSIYPNPTNDKFIIELPESVIGVSIVQIRSFDGKILLEKELTAQMETINLESLSSGMYFVVVQNGKREFVKRIIKN